MSSWLCVISLIFAVFQPLARASMTYDQVVDLIEDRQGGGQSPAYTIDSLIGRLPIEFRSQFALVRESRSSQKASSLFPRVIAFDDQLVMTWNGSHELAGYDTLEMIELKKESSELEFRSIRFVQDPSLPSRPEYSEPNPEDCKGCHGNGLRPNWSDYSTWPGLYGAMDDFFMLDEIKMFADFKENSVANPRYSSLIFSNQFSRSSGDAGYQSRPNLLLGKVLNAFNMNRMAGVISRSSQWKRFGPALMSVLASCDLDTKTFALIRKEVRLEAERQGLQKTSESELTDLLLPLFGVTPESATLGFKQAKFDYFDGASDYKLLLGGALVQAFVKFRPELKDHLVETRNSYEYEYKTVPFLKKVDQIRTPLLVNTKGCDLLEREILLELGQSHEP